MLKTVCLRLMLVAMVVLAACGDDSGGNANPPGGPLLGTVQCDSSSDSCVGTHTRLLAVSHAVAKE